MKIVKYTDGRGGDSKTLTPDIFERDDWWLTELALLKDFKLRFNETVYIVYMYCLKISLLKSNGGAKGLYSGASQFLILGGTVISQLLRIVSLTKEM